MRKSKKMLVIVVVVALIITVGLSITYALWSRSHEQTENNLVQTGCFQTSFSEETPSISLINAYPITDEKGLSGDPYTFKLENTCTITSEYMVKLEVTNQTTMPLNKIKIAFDDYVSILNTNKVGTSTLKKAGVTITNTYIIYTGILLAGEEITHELREWIEYSATMVETENKKLETYITIESVASDITNICELEGNINKLQCKILAQGGGSSAIEAKGNPVFNVVPNTSTSGIYATEDEYGTSYYYRGERNSLSNNLIFAGFQWKIVRINGDGSIRIIYNGTEAQFNSASAMNTTGTNTQIGTSTFNPNNDDNKYMGYMYGGAPGVASTSKIQAQTNETDSAIKTYLDTWYVNNIGNKGETVKNNLADNLFCDDRQLGREYPGAPTSGSGWNGTGFGKSTTYYASYYRYDTNASNPSPILKCAQKNDRFTVSDTATGNGDLTYPIGLLSADELIYGGLSSDYDDSNQYLSTSQGYWILSSNHFNGNFAFGWAVFWSDYLTTNFVNLADGVRPILNLSSSVNVISGDGSAVNPYKI